jgi:hypothetical protein
LIAIDQRLDAINLYSLEPALGRGYSQKVPAGKPLHEDAMSLNAADFSERLRTLYRLPGEEVVGLQEWNAVVALLSGLAERFFQAHDAAQAVPELLSRINALERRVPARLDERLATLQTAVDRRAELAAASSSAEAMTEVLVQRLETVERLQEEGGGRRLELAEQRLARVEQAQQEGGGRRLDLAEQRLDTVERTQTEGGGRRVEQAEQRLAALERAQSEGTGSQRLDRAERRLEAVERAQVEGGGTRLERAESRLEAVERSQTEEGTGRRDLEKRITDRLAEEGSHRTRLEARVLALEDRAKSTDLGPVALRVVFPTGWIGSLLHGATV